MKTKKLKIFYILIAAFLLSAVALFIGFFDLVGAEAEVDAKGSGSKRSPYLISSAEDFISFAYSVNEGNRYKDAYFLQTADIDFNDAVITSVGVYGNGNYFYGVYDGGGHSLSNFRIEDEGRSTGLFGTLGGTVRNLSLASGTITGDCVGGVAASSADGTALIVNCFSSVTIVSSNRGGGIADNFAGTVYNCVSAAKNNGSYAPLCGYGARIVSNSYTLGKRVNGSKSSNYTAENSEVIGAETLSSWEFVDKLNGGIFSFAAERGDIDLYKDYKFWTLKGGNVSLTEEVSLKISSEWEGEGTADEPYLIEGFEDFLLLVERSNSEEDFSGVYFLQTEDIDCHYYPMGAVSAVSGKTSFEGYYDGYGHTISNYCLDDGKEENTALFGRLGGGLYNLGMENGYVIGNCVAGLAVNSSSGETLIFNCYSKAALYGNRAGGLVDNFAGILQNCVSDAVWNGKTAAPAVGYLCRDIEMVFSTGKVIESACYDIYTDNFVLTVSSLYSAGTTNTLNVNADSIFFYREIVGLNGAAEWALDTNGGFNGILEKIIIYPSQGLKGKGTKANPYIVATVEDFIFFHDSVNSGYAYNGRYVRQTADLDFEGLSLDPVGIYDSGRYFYGTYDGGGHVIENLDVVQDYGREMTGLFGSLAGHLYNLGYVSGTVYGEIVGGFANYGSTAEGTIVNCYFTGNIYAFRASGIADSFRGEIVNCWSDAVNLYDGETVPLNAIVATKIIHCFSTGEINAAGYDVSVDSCTINASLLKEERFITTLNAGCLYAARENFCTLKSLTAWKLSSGKLRLGDYFSKNYDSYISSFRGLGTKWSPYRIRSAEDLKLLQLITASGEEYKNQYFIQTNNIDCSSLSGAIPIAELQSGVFYAVYDGRGYEISNLELSSSIYDGACAFIRTMGGTVKNVCLNNCSFTGTLSAGVACYADVHATTRIVNCLVTNSVVRGFSASAGILCYGTETRVYNCLYLSSEERSSQYFCLRADRLYGCYTDVNLTDENYLYTTRVKCYQIDGTTVALSDAVDGLNENIISLKTLLNENIVGKYARFALDGKTSVRFNGLFRITPANFDACMRVMRYDLNIYIAFVLAALVLVASIMFDIGYAGYKRNLKVQELKRNEKEAASVPADYIDSPEKFLKKRRDGVYAAENKLIGLGGSERKEIGDDENRVKVDRHAGGRKPKSVPESGELVLPVPKRKRGRPRKDAEAQLPVPQEGTQSAASAAESEKETVGEKSSGGGEKASGNGEKSSGGGEKACGDGEKSSGSAAHRRIDRQRR